MRPSRVLASTAVAALGLLACEDAKQPLAPAPTAEADGSSLMTPSAGPNLAAQINDQINSVCKSYRKASTLAKAELAKDTTNVDLQADVKAYDALIDDACN